MYMCVSKWTSVKNKEIILFLAELFTTLNVSVFFIKPSSEQLIYDAVSSELHLLWKWNEKKWNF